MYVCMHTCGGAYDIHTHTYIQSYIQHIPRAFLLCISILCFAIAAMDIVRYVCRADKIFECELVDLD